MKKRKRKTATRLNPTMARPLPPSGRYGFESFAVKQSVPIKTREEMVKIRNAASAWVYRQTLAHEDDPNFTPWKFQCAWEAKDNCWYLYRIR